MNQFSTQRELGGGGIDNKKRGRQKQQGQSHKRVTKTAATFSCLPRKPTTYVTSCRGGQFQSGGVAVALECPSHPYIGPAAPPKKSRQRMLAFGYGLRDRLVHPHPRRFRMTALATDQSGPPCFQWSFVNDSTARRTGDRLDGQYQSGGNGLKMG